MKVLATMFIFTVSTSREKVLDAYTLFAGRMKGSGMLLCGVIATVPVWMSASKRPSGCAPMATRCSVSVRPPTTRYTPSRDSTIRTGRPASRAAADGAAGLRVLNSGVRVDLLVTDVGLPGGMNGRQLADAARVARPALKVLFITGYAENAVLSHGHLEPGMHVLTKPFAMEALAGRIRELIAGSRDADPVAASRLPA